MQVIKRNGIHQNFDINRIINAIESAMNETDAGIDESIAINIAQKIEDEILNNTINNDVESIQDRVEILLMESNRHDVAKRYIIYRFEKSTQRNGNNDRNSILSEEFLSKYKHKKPPFTNLGHFVYLRTYSRWLNDKNRREYWWETVRRAVEYNCSLSPNTTVGEAELLYDNIFNLKQFLSGRTLFTGGTEVSKKYPMSNYNCSFTIVNDFSSFKDLFYLLLIGAGVGLRIKQKDVDMLPSIRGDINLIHKAYMPIDKNNRAEYTSLNFINKNQVEIIVGDSKEGWCQGLEYFFNIFSLKEYNQIDTVIFNYNNVRPQGERLKTFGGYASGHQPYIKMIDKIYNIFKKDNQNRKNLQTIDCMDIANIIGISVVSGGVRRTSEVILFEPNDNDIYKSKTNLYKQIDGKWVIDKNIEHRRMSNNSIQYEEKPTKQQWHKHINEMRFSGEPGFQNLQAAKSRREDAEGGNPCMEILLRNRGMCNLTEINVMGFVDNNILNYDALYKAQKLSARAGYRMACIDFELNKWDKVNKEDMLIGCGLTGWQDMVNATNMKKEEQIELLKSLKNIAHKSADELAGQLGKNRPKLYTTIKPSGTLSQLPTVSNGVHFSHSPFFIRRVRINAHDPLVEVVKELGYSINPEVGQTWEDCDTIVIDFPIQAPNGRTKYDVSAIEQLEIYKMFMDYYVDHNTSITIHVRDNEWEDVENWCYENWDNIVAVSFLSLNDSFYQLMPYEEISEKKYNELISNMKQFNPNLLQKYERNEIELDIGNDSCENGVCPIR